MKGNAVIFNVYLKPKRKKTYEFRPLPIRKNLEGDNSTKKLRRKIPKMPLIELLNRKIEEINLSISTLCSLKKIGVINFAELRKLIEELSPKLEILGMRSREEIDRICQKNGLKLRSNWRWIR
jgi:DNA-directed RNA polymerase alpha subunit